MYSLVHVQLSQNMLQGSLFSFRTLSHFTILLIFLCVTLLSDLTDALKTPSDLNGFKLKYYKTSLESKFSENKFVKARLNFCILNFERKRLKEFHFKREVTYFQSRCDNFNSNVYFGFANGSLTDIVKCAFFTPDERWSFANFQQNDMEDSTVFLRRFVQLEFWNGNLTLKIFQHQEKFHYYAKTSNHLICDVTVENINFNALFYPVPKFNNVTDCKRMEKLGPINSDNFWYETAFHLLNDQEFKLENQNLKKKKYATGARRQVVLNIQMYQDEQTFLSTKIYPNIPSDQQANILFYLMFSGVFFSNSPI